MLRMCGEAILRCGRRLFRAQLGLLMVLHTWGQLLNASYPLSRTAGLRRLAAGRLRLDHALAGPDQGVIGRGVARSFASCF